MATKFIQNDLFTKYHPKFRTSDMKNCEFESDAFFDHSLSSSRATMSVNAFPVKVNPQWTPSTLRSTNKTGGFFFDFIFFRMKWWKIILIPFMFHNTNRKLIKWKCEKKRFPFHCWDCYCLKRLLPMTANFLEVPNSL